MGNVKVQYKQKRDGNEAGAEITDPKEFFKMMFEEEDQYAKTKAAFSQMPADKQAEFKAVFGETDVLESHADANNWILLVEADDDEFQEPYEKIKAIMS